MLPYEKKILDKLLKKYERSKTSKEGSTRNLSISLIFNEKNIPEYVNDSSYLFETEIEEAVISLKNKNYVDVRYDRDGRIDRVILNLDKISECYFIMNRKSPLEKRNDIKLVIEKYRDKGYLPKAYSAWVEKQVNEFQSTKKYFKNAKELEEILFILDKLENQKEEISLRSFSAKYLKDSKRLETILSKIETIIKTYDSSLEDEVLSKYNVYQNPSFVYIKGKGKFKINHQIIDLDDLQSELILSSHHIENLIVLELNCNEIITVENLTSFYDYPMKNRCIIYLGGFHNEIRKKLLWKLYAFDNNIPFLHSGDIDVGGFYILNHLIEKTKIPFKTKDMNIETLKLYDKYTIPLTIEDRKRLLQIMTIEKMASYKEIFQYMLENNVKLEQENIKYE